MNLPKTGITTTIVKNALGVSSNVVSVLCTSNNINMWSRMKPVHIASTSTPDRNSQWWRGSDYRSGISLPNGIVHYKDIPSAMTADGKNGWGYNGPRGGSVSPYRLADFMEYKSDAIPPIHEFSVQKEVEKNGVLQGRVMYSPISSDKTGPGSITLDDIRGAADQVNLGDYYLGMLITDSSGTVMGRVVGGKGNDHFATDYSVSGLDVGKEYTAYPFLARVPMTQYETDLSNTYYTLPNSLPSKFKVAGVSLDVRVYLTAQYNYDADHNKTSIGYNLTVTALRTNITANNNAIYMRFSHNKPLDPIESGEDSENIPNLSLVKDVPYTKRGFFTINKGQAQSMYYIYATLGMGAYTARVLPMEEAPGQ